MTRNDVAKLSFKLLAVSFVIKLFYQTQDIFWYLFYSHTMQDSQKTQYVASIFPSILVFLAGIILWFIAPYLANSTFRPAQGEEKEQVSLESIHGVAFSLAGLFLIATSFREIVEYVVYGILKASPAYGYPVTSLIITALVKIVFGLWLIFGSKGIVKAILKFRTARIVKGESSNE